MVETNHVPLKQVIGFGRVGVGKEVREIDELPLEFGDVCRTKYDDSFAPFKSPGADGIYPVLLQKGFEYIKHVLKKLLVSSFVTGYIPRSWRDIAVKFIPKGGHASYEEAKSLDQSV